MSREVVDLSNLREVTAGDVELEKELFEEFINSSNQLLDELEKHSKDSGDNESWRKVAHAFKGIAANLGAAPLAAMCKQAQECFQQSSGQKAGLLSNIKSEHAKVLQFLNTK